MNRLTASRIDLGSIGLVLGVDAGEHTLEHQSGVEQQGFRKAATIRRCLDAELHFYAIEVFKIGLTFQKFSHQGPSSGSWWRRGARSGTACGRLLGAARSPFRSNTPWAGAQNWALRGTFRKIRTVNQGPKLNALKTCPPQRTMTRPPADGSFRHATARLRKQVQRPGRA